MSVLCISHIKDVDGLASAAQVLAAKGGSFRLTDYDSLFDELGRAEGFGELVLCDLGTDASRFSEFRDRLERLARETKVTYIDHHYLTPDAKSELRKLPIRLVHNANECSGMLVYRTFRGELPPEARFLALYAAVTDYMDGSRMARGMVERFDRQFVLLESTMLSYALANHGRDYQYLEMLVRELAKMKPPHAIRTVPESALEQAKAVSLLASEVGERGKRLRKLAYMVTDESSTGNVAKLLLGAFDVPVGVSYKEKRGAGRVEVSLRCTSECRLHLGQTIGEIAGRHGGSGGGHKKAAGCTVPSGEIGSVLRELDAAL